MFRLTTLASLRAANKLDSRITPLDLDILLYLRINTAATSAKIYTAYSKIRTQSTISHRLTGLLNTGYISAVTPDQHATTLTSRTQEKHYVYTPTPKGYQIVEEYRQLIETYREEIKSLILPTPNTMQAPQIENNHSKE